ncbi:DUF1931 domain-containing protein [Candidatus Woesearchaeota archaeon]|nr:DUF1931 domain-containing protein [Candidatus Woesearchaeota archaeon]MBT7237690.1 DUF1931 domain-containing protein [Candidatus Woesearchaeota archaeon]
MKMLVVKSKIKEYVKDCNVSGDFAEALNREVETLISKAEERCKANGRKTCQARDL